MCLQMLFQGDEGGNMEAYGPGLGRESLSGSPSSKTMCWSSECARLVGRDGDDWGGRFGGVPRGGGDAGQSARIFMRVGACANELRLLGVTRAL